ncbi:hypothetical protein Cantr_09520 [Candida viswanathii]|uniref:Uncharacterized protein n=1 Tax=Candida viswanathii TaxID=5486 RepID=A0A367YC39_9ASCO|nr:hypothetical protein Cantr_09520 [Candida viswanathii]
MGGLLSSNTGLAVFHHFHIKRYNLLFQFPKDVKSSLPVSQLLILGTTVAYKRTVTSQPLSNIHKLYNRRTFQKRCQLC